LYYLNLGYFFGKSWFLETYKMPIRSSGSGRHRWVKGGFYADSIFVVAISTIFYPKINNIILFKKIITSE